jgi:hypothetical protein
MRAQGRWKWQSIRWIQKAKSKDIFGRNSHSDSFFSLKIWRLELNKQR